MFAYSYLCVVIYHQYKFIKTDDEFGKPRLWVLEEAGCPLKQTGNFVDGFSRHVIMSMRDVLARSLHAEQN